MSLGAAVAAVIVLAGIDAPDMKTIHLRWCSSTGECGLASGGDYSTVPAAEGELCVLPATIPCVLGGDE